MESTANAFMWGAVIVGLSVVVPIIIVVIVFVVASGKATGQKRNERKRMGKPADDFNSLYVSGIKESGYCWKKFIWQGHYYLGWHKREEYESGTFMIEITK